MRIKFKGEWYEIQCFNITKNDGTAFITKDFECNIEDIEINGRHLGREDNFPTNAGIETNCDSKRNNRDLVVGDEVIFLDKDGVPISGKITKISEEENGAKKYNAVSNDEKYKMYGMPAGYFVLKGYVDSDRDLYRLMAEHWRQKARYFQEVSERRDDQLADASKTIDWEQRIWEAILIKGRGLACDIDTAKSLVEDYRKGMNL
jgi:hypothetical protein